MPRKNQTVKPGELPEPLRHPEILQPVDPDELRIPEEDPDVIPEEDPFENPPEEIPEPGEGP